MGLFGKRGTPGRPSFVSIFDQPLTCVICGNDQFWYRELKMNTSGMELLNMSWANQSSSGVICAACGYVHEFVGRSVAWSREREATPEEIEAAGLSNDT
jgi:hypothetical protein